MAGAAVIPFPFPAVVAKIALNLFDANHSWEEIDYLLLQGYNCNNNSNKRG